MFPMHHNSLGWTRSTIGEANLGTQPRVDYALFMARSCLCPHPLASVSGKRIVRTGTTTSKGLDKQTLFTFVLVEPMTCLSTAEDQSRSHREAIGLRRTVCGQFSSSMSVRKLLEDDVVPPPTARVRSICYANGLVYKQLICRELFWSEGSKGLVL